MRATLSRTEGVREDFFFHVTPHQSDRRRHDKSVCYTLESPDEGLMEMANVTWHEKASRGNIFVLISSCQSAVCSIGLHCTAFI